jgi:restriction system protein
VRTRVPAGSILAEDEYEFPLLEALADAGGEAPSREVTEAVGRKLAGRLTDLDREQLKSGGIRWENRIQFVRLKMIERGLMLKDTPRGIWALSDEGRRHVEQNR